MRSSLLQRVLTPTIFLILFCVLFAGIQPLTGKNAQSFNEEGYSLLEKGYSYKALFSFKNALQKNQRYLPSIEGLARAYYQLEVYDKSLELYKEALKLDYKSFNALQGMGLAYSALGKYQLALAAFKKAEKLSGDNLAAHYGIAELYYRMGKLIWAQRKLGSIFKINRYHYKSLLLQAQIKSDENRLSEAREIIERAIAHNEDNPMGFTQYGGILFSHFLRSGSLMYLKEAENALQNALAINNSYFPANRLMGRINIYKKDYETAIDYLKRASEIIPNSIIQYHLAAAYDLGGKQRNAVENFLSAYKLNPSDALLRARLEDFFLLRRYKAGHPGRIMLSKEQSLNAKKRSEKHLADEAILYLRRAITLNPMDQNIRERLITYYNALDYNRLYINQLKTLLRLYPGRKYQDRLTSAIYKRRGRLYEREGYARELPPRNVPKILVLNFASEIHPSVHYDTGITISNSLDFALQQFGRMAVTGLRKRMALAGSLSTLGDHLEKTISKIQKYKSNEGIDFVVYGSSREQADTITATYHLMDLSKGVVIDSFTISESGRYSVMNLSLRAAKRIYTTIPYSGRILKIENKSILVNLGSKDGIKKGDRLVVYKQKKDHSGRTFRASHILTIKEADTFLSLADAKSDADVDLLDSRDKVYPLKQRRAKRIEE